MNADLSHVEACTKARHEIINTRIWKSQKGLSRNTINVPVVPVVPVSRRPTYFFTTTKWWLLSISFITSPRLRRSVQHIWSTLCVPSQSFKSRTDDEV